MQGNKILIGTGFYATKENHVSRHEFYLKWLRNSNAYQTRVVVVDNSDLGLMTGIDVARIYRNLGHASTPFHKVASTPLLGWSISWMIPALIAYSECCDFIYKEQDCLAFGDWLPIVCQGAATMGRNSIMPCEQSLFYIRHDFILQFIKDFLAVPGHDAQVSTEDKFGQVMRKNQCEVKFHDLQGGRERPLPDLTKPFYLQKITPEEMQLLNEKGLV